MGECPEDEQTKHRRSRSHIFDQEARRYIAALNGDGLSAGTCATPPRLPGFTCTADEHSMSSHTPTDQMQYANDLATATDAALTSLGNAQFERALLGKQAIDNHGTGTDLYFRGKLFTAMDRRARVKAIVAHAFAVNVGGLVNAQQLADGISRLPKLPG